MLDEQLRDAWHARVSAIPITHVPKLAPEGLVLGAGTVVVAAEGLRRLQSLEGQEARVLALLSAAYGRAVAPSMLGNIERAAKSWSEGDDCLAYIHLAHGGLQSLRDPRAAACRLFIADNLMSAGVRPRTIYEALKVGDAVEKVYNPAEPRVPAGSGRTSGEWTRGLSVLGDLTAEAAEQLGRFALRLLSPTLGEAAAAFGLLFIPSPNNVRVEGEVPDLSGLSYSWNRDESLLHLTYDSAEGGQHTFTAQLEDDLFRDDDGRIVGRILPDGTVVIDPAAISADLVQEDEPKLCPAPGPDKGGSEIGRDYEDFVKSVVNPENPTPRGWGFQLLNPEQNGALVYYDDCQQSTGMMIEAKGGYAGVLSFPEGKNSVSEDWLDQSSAQVAASGGRPIRWYFAEPETAAFAEGLFATGKGGRERIEIVVLPWSGSGP